MIVVVITFIYFIAELGTAIYSKSLSLEADSFHMLSDVMALLTGHYAAQYAKLTSTDSATYGWSRTEVIGALANCVFLLGIVVEIFLASLERLIEFAHGDVEVKIAEDSTLVLWVAGAGLVVNLISLLIFSVSGEGHHHHHHHHHGDHDHCDHGSVMMGDRQRVDSVLSLHELQSMWSPVPGSSNFSSHLRSPLPEDDTMLALSISSLSLDKMGGESGGQAAPSTTSHLPSHLHYYHQGQQHLGAKPEEHNHGHHHHSGGGTTNSSHESKEQHNHHEAKDEHDHHHHGPSCSSSGGDHNHSRTHSHDSHSHTSHNHAHDDDHHHDHHCDHHHDHDHNHHHHQTTAHDLNIKGE